MKFILAALGLVIGNFLMNEYAIALERSFFQCVAIFTVWLLVCFGTERSKHAHAN